ncbi:uncharacterized protein K452DRAFT_323129 [Aplosporella prunicola CBS 121167]|uniref:Altered inheritance of mitochondria protein 13, mitochondrial n=1 Tax=Aplosporella prunicola CBS 121167 TaxID=1176127 RepID=A0A6A6ATL2_9PEZI|nr:uncharacterized protein K452DRAFT_323129 [Aplosporella prunicola CBS 121167]KAF2135309.1 hypothetical protein K452DRAFT_323129 [Aplosporella prunicola CBS 121167]
MGAGNSKPEGQVPQHIFNANAPVRFSSELADTLQNSPQSDATRSKAVELEVQTRVAAELAKLRANESQRLRELQDQIVAETDAQVSSSASLTEKLSAALSSSETLAEKQRHADMSRGLVEREIAALKTKLEGRKKIDHLDPGVEKAKDEIVACLRINDRRPLDCWREVEAFRREVGRLEKEFVEKTVR